MRQSRKRHAVQAVLTIVLLGVFLVGCSDNPVEPQVPAWEEFDVAMAKRAVDAAADQDCGNATVFEGVITPDKGGKIKLGSKDIFHVPHGAVDEVVTIHIESNVFERGKRRVLVLDCSPDGLNFKTPARLSVDVRPFGVSQGDRLQLFYFNPDTQQWELEQVVRVHGGKAVFYIHHFSKYAIT